VIVVFFGGNPNCVKRCLLQPARSEVMPAAIRMGLRIGWVLLRMLHLFLDKVFTPGIKDGWLLLVGKVFC
jgi:hypothetical protein